MIGFFYDNFLKKREANFASLQLFVFYLFLVILDIKTTLLTDENLKHEGNIITTFFVDNKQEFIIYVLGIAFMSITLTYIANIFMVKCTFEKKNNSIKKTTASIIIIFFYTHFLSLLWVIPNNLLHFIGINGNSDWILFDFSKCYVLLSSKYYPYYQIIMQSALFFIAIILFIKLKYNIQYRNQ